MREGMKFDEGWYGVEGRAECDVVSVMNRGIA